MAIENVILPDNHFKKRVKNQYGSVSLAVARELIQNSNDAGSTAVEITTADGQFACKDNGCGMTLGEFRQFYLHFGGSLKRAESVGGFGAAKEVLSFAWESWSVKSMGFRVTGNYANNVESFADSIIGKGFEIGAQDKDLPDIAESVVKVFSLSDIRLSDVKVNGQPAESGRRLRKNQVVKEFGWGTLYVHKSQPNSAESVGYMYIRSRGLYTTNNYVSGDYVWYLDISASSIEVLSESRDSLKWQFYDEVLKEVNSLIAKPERIERKPETQSLKVYAEFKGNGNSGVQPADKVQSQDLGSFGVDYAGKITRLNCAIAAEKPALAKKAFDRDGNLLVKHVSLLEKWHKVLELVRIYNPELPQVVAGLYLGESAEACYFDAGVKVICINPNKAKASPFYFLELAMHEYAHYHRGGHSQEFENARMKIAENLGDVAGAIIKQIMVM